MGKHKKNKSSENKSKAREYKYLYGIPHCHTSLSTGKGSPKEALNYARNKGLDFLIITDHNSCLDETIKTKKKTLLKWDYLYKSIKKFNKKYDNFISLLGFEADTRAFGHINVINSKNFFKGSLKDIDKLYLWAASNEPIISINHPQSSVEKVNLIPDINNYINTIEVGNGIFPSKQYHRYEKRYYKMLDMGWKLGAINSQDNHRLNFGDGDNLTVVLSKSRNADSLLEGLKNRRTYSTESRSLRMSFSINNGIMGEVLKSTEGEKLNFSITAEDKINKIEKLQVITQGGKIIKEIDLPPESKVKYYFNLKASNEESWYVVKLKMCEERYAISSPIFIDI